MTEFTIKIYAFGELLFVGNGEFKTSFDAFDWGMSMCNPDALATPYGVSVTRA